MERRLATLNLNNVNKRLRKIAGQAESRTDSLEFNNLLFIKYPVASLLRAG
ncbi:MAG: hypothetical protein ACXW1D_09470 [Halobacteriota archaeon]